jgi:hypothetical protein
MLTKESSEQNAEVSKMMASTGEDEQGHPRLYYDQGEDQMAYPRAASFVSYNGTRLDGSKRKAKKRGRDGKEQSDAMDNDLETWTACVLIILPLNQQVAYIRTSLWWCSWRVIPMPRTLLMVSGSVSRRLGRR